MTTKNACLRGTEFNGSDPGQCRGVRLTAERDAIKSTVNCYWNVTVTIVRVNYSVQDHHDEVFQADD